jgi:hypothetical protein
MMKTSPPRLVIVARILGMFLALGWQSNVSATHFDVSKLALKACDFQGTLLVKADYFQTEALSMVVQISEHARRVLARKTFADLYETKEGFLDVTFAGMQDGRLSLVTRGFEIGPPGVVRKTQHLIQEADNGVFPILQIIGPDDAIVAYMHTHKLGRKDGLCERC